MHYTDTVDLVFVFEGTLQLTLDDGTHALGPGDRIVLNGVDHAWQAGAAGCCVSGIMVGTPPAASRRQGDEAARNGHSDTAR
jgi:quercetin dioxygenase-like cupin family protein